MTIAEIADPVLALICIVVGIVGVALGVRYRDRVARTPLTEALWAISFAQMWLGTALRDADVNHVLQLSTAALGIAVAQYRIWSVLRRQHAEQTKIPAVAQQLR